MASRTFKRQRTLTLRVQALYDVRAEYADWMPTFSIAYFQHPPMVIADREHRRRSHTLIDLNKSTSSAIAIPLPTLREQRAIAAALRDVDTLLTSARPAHRQEARPQTGRHAATAHRPDPPAGLPGEWEVKRFGEIAMPRKERIDPRRAGLSRLPVCELEHIEQRVWPTRRHRKCRRRFFAQVGVSERGCVVRRNCGRICANIGWRTGPAFVQPNI